MNLGLENKVALVTGSSKGLGFATAKQLASEGARVIICSRDKTHVTSAVEKIRQQIKQPSNVTGVPLDLSATDKLEAFISEQATLHDGLDILITNTAGPSSGLLDDISLDDVSNAYQQLVAPTFQLIKTAIKYLRNSKHSSILTITSLSAKQPIPGLLLSNMLRPAITALSKNLSQELGPLGIRVNSILPGWISTERSKQLFSSSNNSFDQLTIEQDIPLGRIGTPEEFANAATFLVSPAASYINGIMLPIDGGLISGLT